MGVGGGARPRRLDSTAPISLVLHARPANILPFATEILFRSSSLIVIFLAANFIGIPVA